MRPGEFFFQSWRFGKQFFFWSRSWRSNIQHLIKFPPCRLSGVDSLAVLTLCRQLRLAAQGSECIKPQDFFRCGSVGELIQLVDQQQPCEQQSIEATGDWGQPRTIWFAPGQVNSTCKWLYGCRGSLDPICFRRAAARLLARHEGLRAEMESPAGQLDLRKAVL